MKAWIKRALDALNTYVSNGNIVLDVGCGNGELLESIYQDSDLFCVGVDFDWRAIKNTSLRLKRGNFILADATRLPIHDGTMNIVVSSQFFEHVYDVTGALEEQLRVLKVKGRIIIDQANLLSIFTLCNLLFLYPLKTRGKKGGLKWLINRHKMMKNSYYKYPAKDEDVKSILWWKNVVDNLPTTLIDIYSPLSKRLNVNNIYLKTIISFFSHGLIIILTRAYVKEPEAPPLA